MSLTVILPTYNEELHLSRTLGSLVGWAERIIVLDSYSSDRTVELARRHAKQGVELVSHPYSGPAEQKNWALDALSITTEWILFLDADELVTPELRDELLEVTGRPDNPLAGYFISRRIIWYGRWMRHGGWFPNWNLRLLRRGCARYEQRRVHEHMLVDGPTGYLEHHLIHEDLRDLTHSIAKHNRYSDLEAQEYRSTLQGATDQYARLLGGDPLARRRWLKTRVAARLPLKGVWYFLYAYVLRLGFLDGSLGLRFHLLQAMFKHFDELKLWELQHYKQGAAKGGIALQATYWERYLQERGLDQELYAPLELKPLRPRRSSSQLERAG